MTDSAITEAAPQRKRFTRHDVIRLPPQDKPIYFVIVCGEHGYGTYSPEVRDYVFEEGDCPVNIFVRGVEQIITDGEVDPHGLFEFVKTIDAEERFAYGTDTEWWREVLPEAFEDDK